MGNRRILETLRSQNGHDIKHYHQCDWSLHISKGIGTDILVFCSSANWFFPIWAKCRQSIAQRERHKYYYLYIAIFIIFNVDWRKTNRKHYNVLSSLGWVFLVGVSGGSFDVWYLDFRRKFRGLTISNWWILWGISSRKKVEVVFREEKWYRRFSFCPFEITFTRKVRWSGPPVNL